MTIKMKVDGKLVDIGGVPAPTVNQDASGISVGGTALQDASTSQDGLMTKQQVASLNSKADKSTVDAIGVTNEIGGTAEAPTLTTTVNGKSSTVNLPASGEKIEVIDTWQ